MECRDFENIEWFDNFRCCFWRIFICILFRESHVRFYLNHLIRFVVGLAYIYVWIMARSLYMVMGRIGYTGSNNQSTTVIL